MFESIIIGFGLQKILARKTCRKCAMLCERCMMLGAGEFLDSEPKKTPFAFSHLGACGGPRFGTGIALL